MGRLLNMALKMQESVADIVVTYTPSPFSRAVRVTLSQSVTFDKSFIVDWLAFDSSFNLISGSVTVTVPAGSTTGTSGNQIVVGESFQQISIQSPSPDAGYNWTYGGDWIA